MLRDFAMTNLYDKDSQVQREAALRNMERFAQYFRLSCSLPGPPRFLDIGCSTGQNEVLNWMRLLEDYKSQQCFELVFSDLPSNDWNCVMKNSAAFETLLDLPSRMTFSCVSGSYTNTLQLPNSINFVLSCNAIHFLTHYEPTLDSFVLLHTKDSRVKSLNTAFAAEDLEMCLQARANELKPGGYFVSISVKNFPESYNSLLTITLNSLIDRRIITEQEGLGMNLAFAMRSREDFEAAVAKVSDLFELVEHEDFSFVQSIELEASIAILRTLTEVKIYNAIKASRPDSDPQPIVEMFYRHMGTLEYSNSTVFGEFQYAVIRRKD